jgi:uncharacterized membrane protein
METILGIYMTIGLIVGLVWLFRIALESKDIVEVLLFALALAVVMPFWPWFLIKMMKDE